MKLAGLLVALFLLVGTTWAFTTRYDGHQLWEVTVPTTLQAERLRDVETKEDLDVVWLAGGKVHVMVPPDHRPQLQHFLRSARMEYDIVQQDVQKHIDETMELVAQRRRDWGKFDYDYDNFNEFEQVMDELDALAADCPAGITCEVVEIGTSYNGEPIKQLHIGSGGRQAYWLDSTVHAREWLATTTLMRLTQTLIRDYDTDADAQRLVDTYDWYIVPVMNPDGYIYTWTDNRMWRKNRSPNEGSACIGTDLNRNYDYLWGGVGSSGDPCSITYRGDSAASESETQAVQAEASRLEGQLEAWVSYHTYGQMFLHSWGYTTGGQCEYADDHDELFGVASASTAAIEATHGTSWDPGNWCEVLYASTGTTVDYTKAVGGVKYTYTPELRGNGFDPPPSEIVPAHEEMWNGLVAMVEQIEATYL